MASVLHGVWGVDIGDNSLKAIRLRNGPESESGPPCRRLGVLCEKGRTGDLYHDPQLEPRGGGSPPHRRCGGGEWLIYQ